MVQSWCCVVGPRGIKSRCIWLVIWPLQRQPVAGMKSASASRPFSQTKSRGFHIHKSHISDVQRLSRLLIAACLAYLWVVYLGSVCEKEQWRHIIHRRTRCDLSLFQLGLRFLEYLLNEEMSIPVQFHITI